MKWNDKYGEEKRFEDKRKKDKQKNKKETILTCVYCLVVVLILGVVVWLMIGNARDDTTLPTASFESYVPTEKCNNTYDLKTDGVDAEKLTSAFKIIEMDTDLGEFTVKSEEFDLNGNVANGVVIHFANNLNKNNDTDDMQWILIYRSTLAMVLQDGIDRVSWEFGDEPAKPENSFTRADATRLLSHPIEYYSESSQNLYELFIKFGLF